MSGPVPSSKPASQTAHRGPAGYRLRIALWGTVLLMLGLTLWLAGPKAWRVLAGRMAPHSERGPTVELSRVAVLSTPHWLTPPLFAAMRRDLGAALTGTVRLLDEQAAKAFREQLNASPWVKKVTIRVAYPAGFRLELVLRRPRAALVVTKAMEHADPESGSRLVALLDEDLVLLPPVHQPLDLPVITMAEPNFQPVLGKPITEPMSSDGSLQKHWRAQVAAAVAVAEEWRTEVAPLLPEAPRLVAVDASNLGRGYLADPGRSQVAIGLARDGGGTVWFDYDHPPSVAEQRVPAADKAQILKNILAEHPGLTGLRGGDLRFINTWRRRLAPRS